MATRISPLAGTPVPPSLLVKVALAIVDAALGAGAPTGKHAGLPV